MPRYAPNKVSPLVKQRYFELIRQGMKGAAAARRVGVSTSCGSLWFLDAGGVMISERGPISARFLNQDDRIAIADGLHAQVSVKQIAQTVGKSYQTVYREIQRNSKPDGGYQPWWAHNQALRRRKRPRPTKLRADPGLRWGGAPETGFVLVTVADLTIPDPDLSQDGSTAVHGIDLSRVVRW